MGEHGVDLARIRRQIGLRHHIVAVVARNVLQQLLEIVAVAVDGSAEFAIRLIFAADVVEGLLAFQRIEPAREDVALAPAVAVPQLDRGLMIDGTRNVDRQRIERLHHMGRRARGAGRARGLGDR